MPQPSSFRSPFWPTLSAHRVYWERYNCAQVYEYDPADDGPEVEVIKTVTTWWTFQDIQAERVVYKLMRLMGLR